VPEYLQYRGLFPANWRYSGTIIASRNGLSLRGVHADIPVPAREPRATSAHPILTDLLVVEDLLQRPSAGELVVEVLGSSVGLAHMVECTPEEVAVSDESSVITPLDLQLGSGEPQEMHDDSTPRFQWTLRQMRGEVDDVTRANVSSKRQAVLPDLSHHGLVDATLAFVAQGEVGSCDGRHERRVDGEVEYGAGHGCHQHAVDEYDVVGVDPRRMAHDVTA
jgi:hypothetical protein